MRRLAWSPVRWFVASLVMLALVLGGQIIGDLRSRADPPESHVEPGQDIVASGVRLRVTAQEPVQQWSERDDYGVSQSVQAPHGTILHTVTVERSAPGPVELPCTVSLVGAEGRVWSDTELFRLDDTKTGWGVGTCSVTEDGGPVQSGRFLFLVPRTALDHDLSLRLDVGGRRHVMPLN